ncbi:MAG: alkaline phosphatase family protein [Actinomycetota bacterium]
MPARDTDRAWGLAACEVLPAVWLERIARGYRADRSGEVQIVPLYPNQIDPGLPHNGPWDEVQDVPLFLYGPGVIPAVGRVERPVTVADVTPTVGALADSGFEAPDGHVLHEAADGRRSPRLVVVLVWDAVGRGVLDRHADAWPTLASLIDDGAWYERASVGSSPSQTAQVHATIGTGAFPRTHGLIAHRFRVDGELVTPWGEGTALLEVPTVGDILDIEHDNAAQVGFVGTLMIHLGLLGHGSDFPGGDDDLAVLREQEGAQTLGAEGEEWNLPAPVAGAFAFPSWVARVEPGLAHDVDALDRADGSLDGTWRGNDIATLLDGFDTPARAPYQQRVIEAVIEREGYGADEVTTDVLWVNEKFTDYVSHVWSVDSPEMADAVRSQDDALARLLAFLDEKVGRGRWAIALTADHGSVRPPPSTGGAVLSSVALQATLERRFGEGVVELVQDTQLFLDTDRLERDGDTAADVARTVLALTAGELAPPDADLDADLRNAPAFEAAFPSGALEAMPCISEAAA